MYYQNVRGLRTKLSDLRCSVASSAVTLDFIILFETWLNSGITDAELGLNNFNIFRLDRDKNTSDCSRGGGVLIAVRNNFYSRSVDIHSPNIEHLFVEVRIGLNLFIIVAVYIPPSSLPDVYESHCRSVLDVMYSYSDAKFIILGDFNLPNITWLPNSSSLHYHASGGSHSRQADIICEYFNLCNFYQHNLVKNSSGYELDLIFSSYRNLHVCAALDPLIHCDVHHPALEFVLPISTTVPSSVKYYSQRLCFEQANFTSINDYLNQYCLGCSLCGHVGG